MDQLILFEVSHIKLIKENDVPYLIIDDWELYDFVDDFLWDNFKLSTDGFVEHDLIENKVYQVYFESGVNENNIVSALRKLDLEEVERIYKLNN